MIDVIFYGRGGQGAVTAAQILATAAFNEGKYASSLPFFGGERKGAPVMANTRVSDTPIEIRTPIEKADVIIVLDPVLLKTAVSPSVLKPGGLVVVNSSKSPDEIKKEWNVKDAKIAAIDATALSEKIYGQSAIPKVNTVVLGYSVANLPMVKLESLINTIGEYFGGPDGNKAKESANLGYQAAAGKEATTRKGSKGGR